VTGGSSDYNACCVLVDESFSPFPFPLGCLEGRFPFHIPHFTVGKVFDD
jgi:hypothetical protein